MDARSRNVRKILTVRDLDYVFSAYPQYELMNMEVVPMNSTLSAS
jgi:hypothetical protein